VTPSPTPLPTMGSAAVGTAPISSVSETGDLGPNPIFRSAAPDDPKGLSALGTVGVVLGASSLLIIVGFAVARRRTKES
jgi:hypothetical protein